MRVYIHLRNLGQSEEKIKCGLKPLTFSQKIISSDSQFSGCQSNLKGLQKEEGQGKDGILLPKQWVKKKSASQDVENGQQNEWYWGPKTGMAQVTSRFLTVLLQRELQPTDMCHDRRKRRKDSVECNLER